MTVTMSQPRRNAQDQPPRRRIIRTPVPLTEQDLAQFKALIARFEREKHIRLGIGQCLAMCAMRGRPLVERELDESIG